MPITASEVQKVLGYKTYNASIVGGAISPTVDVREQISENPILVQRLDVGIYKIYSTNPGGLPATKRDIQKGFGYLSFPGIHFFINDTVESLNDDSFIIDVRNGADMNTDNFLLVLNIKIYN